MSCELYLKCFHSINNLVLDSKSEIEIDETLIYNLLKHNKFDLEFFEIKINNLKQIHEEIVKNIKEIEMLRIVTADYLKFCESLKN